MQDISKNIHDLCTLARADKALRKRCAGLCGVHEYNGIPSVQLSESSFTQLFPKGHFDCVSFDDECYPYELKSYVNGVMFFCISEANPYEMEA